MRTNELCARSGATARQVVYWTECGWLTRTVRGSGYPRSYSDDDLFVASVLTAVSQATDAQRRKSVLRQVAHHALGGLAGRYLVATPDHVLSGDDLRYLLAQAGGAAVVVDLHAITGDSGVTPEASGSTSETVNRLAAPAS